VTLSLFSGLNNVNNHLTDIYAVYVLLVLFGPLKFVIQCFFFLLRVAGLKYPTS